MTQVLEHITFRAYGDIVGKERPRYGHGHMYTPEKTAKAQDNVRWQYLATRDDQLHPDMSDWTGEVSVSIRVKNLKAKSTSKPDADNIAKLVCDSLNGLAWKDDSQVTVLKVEKRPVLPSDEDSYMDIDISYVG